MERLFGRSRMKQVSSSTHSSEPSLASEHENNETHQNCVCAKPRRKHTFLHQTCLVLEHETAKLSPSQDGKFMRHSCIIHVLPYLVFGSRTFTYSRTPNIRFLILAWKFVQHSQRIFQNQIFDYQWNATIFTLICCCRLPPTPTAHRRRWWFHCHCHCHCHRT